MPAPPPEKADDDIARRTVSGSLYSVAASLITLSLGLFRTIIMVRLLLPEHFGVTALALFYINLVASLRSLGINGAFMQRKEADRADYGTFFILNTLLVAASTLILLPLVPVIGQFYPQMPALVPVLFVFIGVQVLSGFNKVPETILSKQMAYRSLALCDVVASVAMTIVGPLLALLGAGVWAIVAENASGLLVRAIALGVLIRPWRPGIAFNRETARSLLRYGSNLWAGTNLVFLIDRFDDWWIGTFLGQTPLGYYSRAYEFARYPRRVIANPILSVFFPAFAHLQDDRLRLSRAFFRPTSLMVRSGSLFSLLFVLTAPELIRLFLGTKWLPMLLPFQLMIVYTLLDPLVMAATNLLTATGHAAVTTRTRFAQLLFFVPAVATLGTYWGISGVALAADLMMLLGAILLYRYTRQVVDYSARALWLWPLLALVSTGAIVLALGALWATLPLWGALVAKGMLISLVYGIILWLAERDQLLSGWHMVWGMLHPRLKSVRK